jgi:hypothetical protein
VHKKNHKWIGNCSTKIQPQCTQPPHKKGFKTHLKQKKTQNDSQPTMLDFQIFNHLYDLGHNAKGQLTISYMPAKLFVQKVDSNFREMKNIFFNIGMN